MPRMEPWSTENPRFSFSAMYAVYRTIHAEM
jgi:hypothetical protein